MEGATAERGHQVLAALQHVLQVVEHRRQLGKLAGLRDVDPPYRARGGLRVGHRSDAIRGGDGHGVSF